VRVLVANIPLPGNRFFVDLYGKLRCYCEVEHSSELFWNMQGDFDVVHLHFPEYLTFAHQDAYISALNNELIAETEERLKYWNSHARIVVTRHNTLPHDASSDIQWERLYKTVYQYAHAVVHMGQPSLDEFQCRYEGCLANFRQIRHAMIPHHNYASLSNTIDRNESRRRLGIGQDSAVMLVFGSIRSDDERRLILKTFQGMNIRGKVLLVPTWRERLPRVQWIRLKYWLRNLVRLYHRLHPAYFFSYGFVSEDETQLYLNAADILFIPRLEVLNSGNLILGMTFGRIVVGPDRGNVGAILRSAGMPVFNPEDSADSIAAVERGFLLAAEGTLAVKVRQTAIHEWSVLVTAKAYIDLFSDLLSL
jgi:hypothetical protein